MLLTIEGRAEQAYANQLHPSEFIKLLVQDELLGRKKRSAKTLLNRAHFRIRAELEDWDCSYDRGISNHKFKELTTLLFYQTTENLLILGKTGEGKSQLSVSIGRRLCAENISTLFVPMNFLFEEAYSAGAAGKYLGYIKKLSTSKVFILDDFGLRNYIHEEAIVLVDCLEDRRQKGPVIITSQVNPKGWSKLFEDPVIAEAIIDRLVHPSQRITIKGGSYRVKVQNKKKIIDEQKQVSCKTLS